MIEPRLFRAGYAESAWRTIGHFEDRRDSRRSPLLGEGAVARLEIFTTPGRRVIGADEGPFRAGRGEKSGPTKAQGCRKRQSVRVPARALSARD